jgi:hypothetical protein
MTQLESAAVRGSIIIKDEGGGNEVVVCTKEKLSFPND